MKQNTIATGWISYSEISVGGQ